MNPIGETASISSSLFASRCRRCARKSWNSHLVPHTSALDWCNPPIFSTTCPAHARRSRAGHVLSTRPYRPAAGVPAVEACDSEVTECHNDLLKPGNDPLPATSTTCSSWTGCFASDCRGPGVGFQNLRTCRAGCCEVALERAGIW